jgi:hypothetical protein
LFSVAVVALVVSHHCEPVTTHQPAVVVLVVVLSRVVAAHSV